MQQAQRDVRKLSLVPQFAGIDLEYIELQIVSLLHRLLWIFGGNAMPQPRNIDLNSIDFSPLRNLTLYGFVFRVHTFTPKPFGSFNFTELPDTLLRSKIFAEISTGSLDVLDRSSNLHTFLSVEIPNNLLI